ncbi:DNA polymerase III subunit epsilon [Solemya velum gill symbiont]|uniref:DNA polymerase III subunit epsilon n=1 Tax=Solemya velum gill symbiont TaxID=2340 RepID=UPI000995E50B|nr:DNA polymerase III subunit epsilon [Solemya velum gill symbiont]OOY72990.1 DNA polymerase III subunit epsilon [Solemya velum gill symbiont]OOY75462.1 DNA polymerase III subunit epsilon [Solemya velum gill symbiont]OOY88773.1 DNA polymerase III subunit epsilon [Solemya velum gill symbiont]
MRQLLLDTETTGLDPKQGHRIIEIGCVEMIDRQLTGNNFHQYLQPDREIDAGAIEVHGITNEFLLDKPRFADIADDLVSYLKGAELIIHNAPFDVGFLDHELGLLGNRPKINDICTVEDTLVMARKLHPGKRNSLDALCDRYAVDNSRRDKHGALLDSEILADVYLLMTGGQNELQLDSDNYSDNQGAAVIRKVSYEGELAVLKASDEELAEHQAYLEMLQKSSDGKCVWKL